MFYFLENCPEVLHCWGWKLAHLGSFGISKLETKFCTVELGNRHQVMCCFGDLKLDSFGQLGGQKTEAKSCGLRNGD